VGLLLYVTIEHCYTSNRFFCFDYVYFNWWIPSLYLYCNQLIFLYCVLQVYQADTDHYVKRDKYWGRELNEEGFKEALYHFFHNGFQLRSQVIRKVITRLEELRRAIERQSSYRFYSWWVVELFTLFWSNIKGKAFNRKLTMIPHITVRDYASGLVICQLAYYCLHVCVSVCHKAETVETEKLKNSVDVTQHGPNGAELPNISYYQMVQSMT